MEPIDFTIDWDGVRTLVRMMTYNGGGSNWHLYIGGYYYGSFNLMLGGWRFYGNDKAEAELTTDDRAILLDMIFEHINKKAGQNPA